MSHEKKHGGKKTQEKQNPTCFWTEGGCLAKIPDGMSRKRLSLRLHRMKWGVKTTCFKAPGLSLGESGVSIGGVRNLRD